MSREKLHYECGEDGRCYTICHYRFDEGRASYIGSWDCKTGCPDNENMYCKQYKKDLVSKQYSGSGRRSKPNE